MVRRGVEAGAVAVRLLAIRIAAGSGRSSDIGSPTKASATVPWQRGRGRAAGYPPRLDTAIGCLAADCRGYTEGENCMDLVTTRVLHATMVPNRR